MEQLILKKLSLNNWHYISEKVLTFHDGVNFFTGHSGSGKSTVIDALQLLLYADTDGRGFFNKAAKDDSNRTLMEYLRGMNNLKENGEANYIRNGNFSTTIVAEFYHTVLKESLSIGVIFDVDVMSNDINRMFFMHKSELLPSNYRKEGFVYTVNELKQELKLRFLDSQWDYSRTNEKFRAKLYETYFGGIDEKRFPMLFKKAISFRMDTKLEDFVKEYICMNKDIHIEDMTQSVTQYGRLKRKLEDTRHEIELLEQIQTTYHTYQKERSKEEEFTYCYDKYQIDLLKQQIRQNESKQAAFSQDVTELSTRIHKLTTELEAIQKEQIEVKLAMEHSGYAHLEEELQSVRTILTHLYESKEKFEKICSGLQVWATHPFLSTEDQESLASFLTGTIKEENLRSIQTTFETLQKELILKEKELATYVAAEEAKKKEAEDEIQILLQGQKSYPSYLIRMKQLLEEQLNKQTDSFVSVDILADLIEMKEETWRNAVEGYLGNLKFALIVSPDHVEKAMTCYELLEDQEKHRVALIDTKNVLQNKKEPIDGHLGEEVETSCDYVRAYIDVVMGHVKKCASITELRMQKSGVTKEGLLYQGYKLQQMNPAHYKEESFIGTNAMAYRLERLKHTVASIQSLLTPYKEQLQSYQSLLRNEFLLEEGKIYLNLMRDMNMLQTEELKQLQLLKRIEELKTQDLSSLQQREQELLKRYREHSENKSIAIGNRMNKERFLLDLKQEVITLNEQLLELTQCFQYNLEKDVVYDAFMDVHGAKKPEKIKDQINKELLQCNQQASKLFEQVMSLRSSYLREYSFRGFLIEARSNDAYDEMLRKLQSDKLKEFMEKASVQAKKATYHFKTDFIYKIRDSIKEALQQKEELNRILKHMEFGKETYRFIIEKNAGEDGKFFDMFMDENLDINPGQLHDHMDHQIDLFSSSHSEKYEALIEELLAIFMPPDTMDERMTEEARKRMEKYADYRTYLSFDMEQIIDGMPPMRLSKMLSKNSGGEGQNPLYVALLASFSQIYQTQAKNRGRTRLTPRLVVLDEAFSKMDAEKVGSCVELIRTLGFQSIICATNDKIQNYVDSVDKTFVFANPNKTFISIQSFEKDELKQANFIAN